MEKVIDDLEESHTQLNKDIEWLKNKIQAYR